MNDFVEPIFNMNKVKFDKLDELRVLNQNTKHVNLFINLESVFRILVNARIDNQLRASGYDSSMMQLDIISGIINLGQHYRLYCAKNKMTSKIVLFWNYPMSSYKNKEFITKYRDEYNRRMFRNESCPFIIGALSEIHDLLTTTAHYVNEVYVVDGGVAESSLVPHILTTKTFQSNCDTQNVLISRFRYDYQYIQYGFTVVIPAKDNSTIITPENVIDHMKAATNIKNPLTIPSEQLPTLISILGDDHREIPKIDGYGLSGAVKTINGAIESLQIGSTTQSVEMLQMILKEPHRRQFLQNYRCTNLDYQMSELTPSNIAYVENQIIDKFNDDKLNEINETTFKQCPLMIISPRTEQVRNSERFRYDAKSIFS